MTVGLGRLTRSTALEAALGLTPLLAATPMVTPSHGKDTDDSDSVAPPLLVEALPVQVPRAVVRVNAPPPTAVPLMVQA